MAEPRIGAICRADNGGLGMQTYDFYKHVKPAKTMVVDIAHLTGYPNYFERYPDADIVRGFELDPGQIDSFLQGLDVVFTVEAPYNHYLYQKAREMGVKTICQYNFEWLAHHEEPQLPMPDLFLAPSTWRMGEVPGRVEYLHVPIDRQKFPYKKRTEAKTFLHIAGHRTMSDRNGTNLLLEALPYIENHEIEIIIRTQDDIRPVGDHRLKVVKEDVKNHKDLYEGDVLLLPRRYGGLSLQLNEAMSCGMVPLMFNIPPQDEFLDGNCLLQPSISEIIHIKADITSFSCTPQELAVKIDQLASIDIGPLSEKSDDYAKERDWKIMLPQYRKLFQSLCSPS